MPALPRIRPLPDPSDYAATQEFMRPFVEPHMKGDDKGWIHILDPQNEVRTTNIKAGTYVVENTPIWSGRSRIQPIRNTVQTWRATNPTTTRVVQFWVEFPPELYVDLKPGLRIAVQEAHNSPWLEKYQYVIIGSLNGTQAWQTTIDAQTDLENRPNYDMSDWPTPSYGDEDCDGCG